MKEPADLEDWSNGNEMKLNSAKYKVVHLGANNKHFCRQLGTPGVEMTGRERAGGIS